MTPLVTLSVVAQVVAQALAAPLDPLVVPVQVVPVALEVALVVALVVVPPPVRLVPRAQPGAAAPAVVVLLLVEKMELLVCLQTSVVFWLSLSQLAWLSCRLEGVAVSSQVFAEKNKFTVK